jgi:5-methylcytosine-specific restriction endonuclease McrA
MFGIIDLTIPPPAYVSLVQEHPHLMRRATKEDLDPVFLGHGVRVPLRALPIHPANLTRRRMRYFYPDGRCSYCGDPMGDDDTVDHVVPRAEGGAALGIGNLVPACKCCNNAKADLTLLEFLWRRAR